MNSAPAKTKILPISIPTFTPKPSSTITPIASETSSPITGSQSSDIHEPNFESQTGGFAIWMPAFIEQDDETRAGPCVGATRDIHVFFARSGGAYWLVQYCDLSDHEEKRLSNSEILDQARKDALVDAFATLKEEREITLNGYPGWYIIADSALRTSGMEKPDGTYKARIYLVGNRVYRVATYVFNGDWGGYLEKMDEFLASFVLLKQ